MTANEYLGERARLWKQSLRAPLYTMLAMAGIGMMILFGAVFSVGDHVSSVAFGHQVLWMIVAFLLLVVGSTIGCLIVTSRKHSRFIKDHPEMKHLDLWQYRSGFTNDRYPINEAEMAALLPEAREGLMSLANCARSGFAFRAAAEKCFIDDPELGRVKKFFMSRINKTADEINKLYLGRWDYWTKEIGANPTNYQDPKKFRESRRP